MEKNNQPEHDDTMEIHPLEENWILWYHDPNNSNWDIDSYIKVAEISSIESYWKVFTCIRSYFIQNGMFFLMREGVSPCWEKLPDGGSWSFRRKKADVSSFWNKLAICLTAGILGPEIVGVSVSPKKTFPIVKIWIGDDRLKRNVNFDEVDFLNTEDAIYRLNSLNIEQFQENKKLIANSK